MVTTMIRQEKRGPGRFPKDVAPRETVRRWWRSLAMVIAKELEISFPGQPLTGFDQLIESGRNPISLAIKRKFQN